MRGKHRTDQGRPAVQHDVAQVDELTVAGELHLGTEKPGPGKTLDLQSDDSQPQVFESKAAFRIGGAQKGLSLVLQPDQGLAGRIEAFRIQHPAAQPCRSLEHQFNLHRFTRRA